MATTLSPSTRFIPAYWITMRPYLLFLSGITGMCGLSFSASSAGLSELLLFAAFFLSYGFGQALTDCFQMDTDALSSPYRPLVQGTLRQRDVLIVSLVGLAICGVIFIAFSPFNLVLALLGVVGLITYTWFKKRWWGGPFYNAWIVVSLFFIGVESGATISPSAGIGTFIAAILTVFFGYANFVLTGYFKDVEADRQTGYNTLVVVHGRKRSSQVSNVFALLFSIGGTVAVMSAVEQSPRELSSGVAVALLIVSLVFRVTSQLKLRRVETDRQAYLAILPDLHSYVTMLVAITLVNQPAWMAWLIVFYALYFLTIYSRPEQSQI